MKIIHSVKLFIFVFCLPITFYICGNIKTQDQASFIESEKAREKEELRDRILKRSARAYDNFQRVDPELNRQLSNRKKMVKFNSCYIAAGCTFLVILIGYCLKRKRNR